MLVKAARWRANAFTDFECELWFGCFGAYEVRESWKFGNSGRLGIE